MIDCAEIESYPRECNKLLTKLKKNKNYLGSINCMEIKLLSPIEWNKFSD